jgi:polyferredoxin
MSEILVIQVGTKFTQIQNILNGFFLGENKLYDFMKVLKWIIFSVFVIITILSFIIVFMMYYNLSFIDYPYLFSGLLFFFLSIIIFRSKKFN